MLADLNCHFLVKPLEKIEELVGREAIEMPVHEVRHFWLLDSKQQGDFALFELLFFHQLIHMKTKLCPCKVFPGIGKPQVSKDIAGTFFEFGCFLIVILGSSSPFDGFTPPPRWLREQRRSCLRPSVDTPENDGRV